MALSRGRISLAGQRLHVTSKKPMQHAGSQHKQAELRDWTRENRREQMSISQILSGMNISSTGLAGERMRMEVAANNIANVHSTRSADGGPYRRQQVMFAAAMDDVLSPGVRGVGGLKGVRTVGIVDDPAPLPMIYDPGHPDASAEGFVQMPNVKLPMEMVDMMTASRAYEANLKSMETFRQMAEQALALLRGTR